MQDNVSQEDHAAPSTDREKESPLQAELKRGLKEHGRQNLAEAERIYRGILKKDANHFDAAHLLGVIFLERDQFAQAEAQIRRAIAIDPNVPQAHNNLGNALQDLGRYEEAIECHDRAIALRRRYAEAYNNRGSALKAIGRVEDALASYDRALALKAKYPHAHNNRGNALGLLGRHEEALKSFDKAIELQPRYAQAHGNRASALHQLRRFEEAVLGYNEAIAIRPNFAQAFNNRGNSHQGLRRYDEAIADYDRAIAIQPRYPQAFNNRGNAYLELGRFDEAIADYDQAIALKPDYMDAYRNRAIFKLLMGRLAEGWPDYEQRLKTPAFQSLPPYTDAPAWSGENLKGRSILVWAEQGFGDVVQFSRYLPLLAETGADVTFRCFEKLIPILRSMKGNIRFVTSDELDGKYDFQCALMSLPYFFRTDLKTIPARIPYLFADPKRIAAWRKKIGSHGFRVGICWQGSPIDTGRSAPLSQFYPLSRIPNVRLISLQKVNGLDQLAAMSPEMKVETLGDGFDNDGAFLDTAAVMEHLDLIVTVDTSMVHVAGALGRPVWMALKHVSEWRWFLDRSDSPWYPSLRVFRQKTRGQWGPVFEDMLAAAGGGVHGARNARTRRRPHKGQSASPTGKYEMDR